MSGTCRPTSWSQDGEIGSRGSRTLVSRSASLRRMGFISLRCFPLHERNHRVQSTEVRVDQITMDGDEQPIPSAIVEQHRQAVGIGAEQRIRDERPECFRGRARPAADARLDVGGRPCSPPETFGALIPDALLRSNADSLAVLFYDRAGDRLLITIHRDLIDAYLGRLDSVVALMQRKAPQ